MCVCVCGNILEINFRTQRCNIENMVARDNSIYNKSTPLGHSILKKRERKATLSLSLCVCLCLVIQLHLFHAIFSVFTVFGVRLFVVSCGRIVLFSLVFGLHSHSLHVQNTFHKFQRKNGRSLQSVLRMCVCVLASVCIFLCLSLSLSMLGAACAETTTMMMMMVVVGCLVLCMFMHLHCIIMEQNADFSSYWFCFLFGIIPIFAMQQPYHSWQNHKASPVLSCTRFPATSTTIRLCPFCLFLLFLWFPRSFSFIAKCFHSRYKYGMHAYGIPS